MTKLIKVGVKEFKTLALARDTVRLLIARQQIDVPLTGPDFRFVRDLIDRHPHRDEKVGCGIAYIVVRANRVVGRATRGFWILRTDGTEVDFSWVECLSETTHKRRVLNAMRAAVQDYVFDFKRKAFGSAKAIRCPQTGSLVVFSDADVHHVRPFRSLAAEFLNDDWASVKVNYGMVAAQFGDYLEDEQLRDRWVEFHNQHAELVVMSRFAHRRLPVK